MRISNKNHIVCKKRCPFFKLHEVHNFQNLCKLYKTSMGPVHNGNYPVLLKKKPYLLKLNVGLIGKELSGKNL